MNQIAAIVVTYNRKVLLRENLIALMQQSYEKLDIMIVDNASDDGTYEYIKDLLDDPRMIYQNTGANLGGAGGFSHGIKLAAEKGYDYCWVMDDDTIAQPDALKYLMEATEKVGDFSFLCGMVEWTDGNPCVMNKVNFADDLYQGAAFLREGIIPVKSCSFVSCFLNMKYVRKLGLPIKEFFIYGDDAEYTFRFSEAAPAYFVSKSVVVHKMKDNKVIGIVYQGEDRLWRTRYEYRNIVYVRHKRQHKSHLRIFCYYLKVILDILLCSPNLKFKKIWIVIKAYIAGLRFNPPIEFPGESHE